MSDMQELASLMKIASSQLSTAQEVIHELALQNQELAHDLRARDLAIQMASSGHIAMADLLDKVAELSKLQDEELELQEKVASYTGPANRLHEQGGAAGAVGAMDFLQTSIR